ncbi:MAG TPA: M23 family metallopeptidase, partial [Anaerolineae bacterium]
MIELLSEASYPDNTPNFPGVRLLFDSPVGTDEERRGSKFPPGAWFVAMGFNESYPTSMKRSDFHTGIDLNLPQFGDTGQDVRACADGVIVYSGLAPEWGYLIVVKHVLENGSSLWSRYAHLSRITTVPRVGDFVKRGDLLAHIGEYGKPGPSQDHLHLDIAKIDLGAKPTDWPGSDRVR